MNSSPILVNSLSFLNFTPNPDILYILTRVFSLCSARLLNSNKLTILGEGVPFVRVRLGGMRVRLGGMRVSLGGMRVRLGGMRVRLGGRCVRQSGTRVTGPLEKPV